MGFWDWDWDWLVGPGHGWGIASELGDQYEPHHRAGRGRRGYVLALLYLPTYLSE
jgi:hypothetical protein